MVISKTRDSRKAPPSLFFSSSILPRMNSQVFLRPVRLSRENKSHKQKRNMQSNSCVVAEGSRGQTHTYVYEYTIVQYHAVQKEAGPGVCGDFLVGLSVEIPDVSGYDNTSHLGQFLRSNTPFHALQPQTANHHKQLTPLTVPHSSPHLAIDADTSRAHESAARTLSCTKTHPSIYIRT